MAYPPGLIQANKTDLTVSTTDHPDHHNQIATAINDIVGYMQSVVSPGLAAVAPVTATAPITKTGNAIGVDLAALVTNAALTNAFAGKATEGVAAAAATASSVAGLDTRLALLESSGVVKTSQVLTPHSANANVMEEVGHYSAAINQLATGEALLFEFSGDIENSTGASVVFDFEFAVGTSQVSSTPAAGVSLAATVAGVKKVVHAWAMFICYSPTTMAFAGGLEVTGAKGTDREMALQNGNTSYRDTQPAWTPVGFNVANVMDFKFNYKARTNSASAIFRRVQSGWGIRPLVVAP